jgi:hypothetical protein
MQHHKSGVSINPNAAKMAYQLESGETTIVQYISRSGMAEIYKLYLARWPKERFTLIGDMSRYDVFLDQLSTLLNNEIKADNVKRKMVYNLEISEEDEAKIRDLLADDYEWYRAFIADI